MLERLGGIDFHGEVMKPGKSFVLGRLGVLLEASTPRVGLPFEAGAPTATVPAPSSATDLPRRRRFCRPVRRVSWLAWGVAVAVKR